MKKKIILRLTVTAGALLLVGSVGRQSKAPGPTPPIGIFEDHQDVGTVIQQGSVEYDPGKRAYTLAGSGENMWFANDAFQFVWKKASGDMALTADISFLGNGGNEHRKAVLMVRQDLDANSVYADVALHGNGLTSLQYRDEKGGTTHEIQANLSAPKRLRIEKHGAYVYMLLAPDGSAPTPSGASIRVPLQGTFYVGIGVCSHDKGVTEKAVFSNANLETMKSSGNVPPTLYSSLETINIASTDRRIVYVSPERFEAPNWLRNNAAFLFNSNGRIYRLPITGGSPEVIDTGFAIRCNNDHGISPDASLLAISDQSQEEHRSIVYVVPLGGGTPRRITQNSPSYWHGWSPDGKTLAFVGERSGDFDVYSIPAAGGNESRLTTAKGLDDGPEYSPDGQYIYFNSGRTGIMQIWRMRPDGSQQEQMSSDDFNNWFPHVSPDGKWLVLLSYEKNVTGHPENKDVTLRLMSLSDRKMTVLAKLFGGQGTLNVPSWSPDSKQLAFVSYQLMLRE